MKLNLIRTALIAVFCLAVGYTVYTAQSQNEQLSDTMLENVEALAKGEYGDKWTRISYDTEVETNTDTYSELCIISKVKCMSGGYEDCSASEFKTCTRIYKH